MGAGEEKEERKEKGNERGGGGGKTEGRKEGGQGKGKKHWKREEENLSTTISSSTFLRVVTEARLGKGWGNRSEKRWGKGRGRGQDDVRPSQGNEREQAFFGGPPHRLLKHSTPSRGPGPTHPGPEWRGWSPEELQKGWAEPRWAFQPQRFPDAQIETLGAAGAGGKGQEATDFSFGFNKAKN